ncbi:hypothetical protein FCM35_KLT19655 [Carex littledalei]|uniref:Uncharacterized protein n=1 Tax=Carex littledalei TaxID=544730 RepID=A0A833R8V4_9POAL|nr:hypothetical protein FCM35_KLT19655 [Carex littledalei]
MGKPRRIHPSPSPSPSQVSAVLPVAVAALATALSPQEKDVLFYLLFAASGEPSNLRRSPEHSPDLACGCFSCYKVFWERWDASPNRQVIHEIIEKVEANEEGKGGRRSRRKRSGKDRKRSTDDRFNELDDKTKKEEEIMLVEDANHAHDEYCNIDHQNHDDGCTAHDHDHDHCTDAGKSSVLGRFVRFIGEKLLWDN